MSEVYKIEFASACDTEFVEIAVFSVRGALSFMRAHLAEVGAKDTYFAPSMFAPLRIKSGREAAKWLERLQFRTPLQLSVYGTQDGARKEFGRIRVTCYTILTNWL